MEDFSYPCHPLPFPVRLGVFLVLLAGGGGGCGVDAGGQGPPAPGPPRDHRHPRQESRVRCRWTPGVRAWGYATGPPGPRPAVWLAHAVQQELELPLLPALQVPHLSLVPLQQALELGAEGRPAAGVTAEGIALEREGVAVGARLVLLRGPPGLLHHGCHRAVLVATAAASLTRALREAEDRQVLPTSANPPRLELDSRDSIMLKRVPFLFLFSF